MNAESLAKARLSSRMKEVGVWARILVEAAAAPLTALQAETL
jgi:hypothetical protein